MLLLLTSCDTSKKEVDNEVIETEIITEGVVKNLAKENEDIKNEPLKRKSTADIYREYMKENSIELYLDNMNTLESMELEKYNIYLIGEEHGISSNKDIKVAFTKYLNQNQGVHYVMEEMGYCDTILLTEFLKTGDKNLIVKYINNNKKSFRYTNETYDYYMELYEYNQTLPEDEQIMLVGIDVQHDWQNGLKIISTLGNTEKEMPKPVKNVFEIINKEHPTLEEITLAMDATENNLDIFKEYYQNDYVDFYFGLRSIYQYYIFSNSQNHSLREKYISENFKDMYTEFKIDKCFGMFGEQHVWLNHGIGPVKRLANYLNTEFESTKNKILSINCIYSKCNYLIPLTGENAVTHSSFGSTFSDVLAKSLDTDYGICSSGDLQFENKPLSDKFQYMLCVKNSQAYMVFNKLAE